MNLQSAETTEITQAMIKAQKEFDTVVLDRMGKFSYASVKSIIESTKKHLMNHDIRLEFREDCYSGLPVLYTIFTHGPTGQYTASRVILTVEDAENSHTKSKSQRYGSALTYHMRYSLMSSLGVYADADDIDEHDYEKESFISEAQVRLLNMKLVGRSDLRQTIMQKYGSLEKIPKSVFDHILKSISEAHVSEAPKKMSSGPLSQEQAEQLEHELQGHPDIAMMVLEGLKIKTLADMPKEKFQASLDRIRDIKVARNPK